MEEKKYISPESRFDIDNNLSAEEWEYLAQHPDDDALWDKVERKRGTQDESVVYADFYQEVLLAGKDKASDIIAHAFDILADGFFNKAREIFRRETDADFSNYLAWLGLVECEARRVRGFATNGLETTQFGIYWVETVMLHLRPGRCHSFVVDDGVPTKDAEFAALQAQRFCPPGASWLIIARLNDLVFDARDDAFKHLSDQ